MSVLTRAPSPRELKPEGWGFYFAAVMLAPLPGKESGGGEGVGWEGKKGKHSGNLNLSVESEFLSARGI